MSSCRSIVTTRGPFCIVFYTYRYICQKSPNLYTPPAVFNAAIWDDPGEDFAKTSSDRKLQYRIEWLGCHIMKKTWWWLMRRVASITTGAWRTDGRTDRQTDGQNCCRPINIARQHALLCWRGAVLTTRDRNATTVNNVRPMRQFVQLIWQFVRLHSLTVYTRRRRYSCPDVALLCDNVHWMRNFAACSIRIIAMMSVQPLNPLLRTIMTLHGGK